MVNQRSYTTCSRKPLRFTVSGWAKCTDGKVNRVKGTDSKMVLLTLENQCQRPSFPRCNCTCLIMRHTIQGYVMVAHLPTLCFWSFLYWCHISQVSHIRPLLPPIPAFTSAFCSSNHALHGYFQMTGLLCAMPSLHSPQPHIQTQGGQNFWVEG